MPVPVGRTWRLKSDVQHKSRYRQTWLNGRRTYVHRRVWEEHRGPIPAGAVIHHKDGNRLNNRIENLELITNQKRHREHHKDRGVGWGNCRCLI